MLPCASAVVQSWITEVIRLGRLLHVDQLPSLRRVTLRDEFLDRNLPEGRVGVVLRAILERQLLRLQKQVRVLHAAEAVALHVKPFEDVQHLERRDALGVRRQLPHLVAAIIRRHRIDPLGLVLRQIARREKPAVPFQELLDAPGRLAAIEAIATRARDSLHGQGQRNIAEDFAFVSKVCHI